MAAPETADRVAKDSHAGQSMPQEPQPGEEKPGTPRPGAGYSSDPGPAFADPPGESAADSPAPEDGPHADLGTYNPGGGSDLPDPQAEVNSGVRVVTWLVLLGLAAGLAVLVAGWFAFAETAGEEDPMNTPVPAETIEPAEGAAE